MKKAKKDSDRIREIDAPEIMEFVQELRSAAKKISAYARLAPWPGLEEGGCFVN